MTYISHIVLLLLLLVGSAFFSGAETAFFNLSRRQTSLFQKSGHKLQRLAGRLLSEPRQLLSCLLFGNVTVNVLFYAVASVVVVRIERQIGTTAAAVSAFIAFVVLVLFGEIFPKTLAYANSKSLSITAALPAFLFTKIFAPPLSILGFLIVAPAVRLLVGPAKHPKAITTGEFKSLIEASRKRGLITADENKLLAEIIELGFLKVRHLMQPRVDMIACEVTESAQVAREMMTKNHLTKLPVYAGTIDNIVGIVYLRELLLKADTTLKEAVRRVHFVPEQKTVESLIEFFRKARIDQAIVVNEYGGIAGAVQLEDIAEELLGPIEVADRVEPIEQIGPLKYRLSGSLAVHDWAEEFGIDSAETRICTIAGLVTALLGKIPQSGDVARLKNLKFTVERVRKHRIETLVLTLEPIASDD